jgi:serine phosphatase RsbU (regulator of sigma subunit)
MLTFSCQVPGPRRCLLEVAGYSHSVDAVSGDHVDLVLSASGTKLTMVLGDATGHGASAGLIASEVIGSIRCLATHEAPPQELLSHANRILANRLKFGFMCAAVVQIDLLNREAIYSSAGHYGFHFRRGESTVQLPSDSLPLGFAPDENCSLNELGVVGFDDIIALFSDGIFETMCKSGHPLGTPSVVAQIERSRDLRALEIARSVEEIRAMHQGNGPMRDDTSLLVMKICEAPRRQPEPSQPRIADSSIQEVAAAAGRFGTCGIALGRFG